MNFSGIFISVCTFVLIGIFHPIVIKAEYHFSKRVWPWFLAAGIVCIGASLFTGGTVLSSFFGVAGCSCLWSIGELIEQEKRVSRGWFPKNPKRTDYPDKG